ncbi:hypothetical protein PM082_014475 [Marasmius tenuissimus]|nr:hypothetical protein PM082_014475 [Marasmius tenuissimus]
MSALLTLSAIEMVLVLTGAIFYGAYLILLPSAISILCRREGKRRARLGLLVALLTMFAISSLRFWADVHICFRRVVYDDFGEEVEGLVSAERVVLPLEILVGDSIVLWRVWALCVFDRKPVYISMSFLLGTIICSLGYVGCVAHDNWLPSDSLYNYSPTCNALRISAYSLSFATNVSGTLAIGSTIWFRRRETGSLLNQWRQRRARPEKVLVLLIESGIAYSALWIAQLVLISPTTPLPRSSTGNFVWYAFSAAIPQLVGIYPTVLVVLVYLQYSVWDSNGTLSISPGPPTHSDHRTAHITTVNAGSSGVGEDSFQLKATQPSGLMLARP